VAAVPLKGSAAKFGLIIRWTRTRGMT